MSSFPLRSIRLAEDKESKELVIIKEIQDKGRASMEAFLMEKLKHQNIVRHIKTYSLRDSNSASWRHCIAMEYCSNGDLLEHLNRTKERKLKEGEARRLFKQMLLAVSFVHDQNVCHRDIKLENLLLDKDLNLKLADFGFAAIFDPSGNSLLADRCGTLPYAAPELLWGNHYVGPELDVWSMGVVLFVLCTGCFPFGKSSSKNNAGNQEPKKNSQNTKKNTTNNKNNNNNNNNDDDKDDALLLARRRTLRAISKIDYRAPDFLSPQLKHLLSLMLAPPKRRARVQDISKHCWLLGNLDKVLN